MSGVSAGNTPMRRNTRMGEVSAGVEVELDGEAVGHLDGGGEVGMADDDVAVRQHGLAPVATGLADVDEIDVDDVVAELGEEVAEPLDVGDPPAAPGPA